MGSDSPSLKAVSVKVRALGQRLKAIKEAMNNGRHPTTGSQINSKPKAVAG